MTKGESQLIKKSDAVGYVVYAMAKLGYKRPEIERVIKELRNTFNFRYSGSIVDANLTNGRIARREWLPTIAEAETE
ncbi:hypothetical protein [Lihuaxuella thermophila]|uniref:Uncharacterized protein n=1 Tax=Lihuaxuella thermophila TaxID=1173111 RepID=A0A1H8G7K7_9BACL|nr:hypothetical protein [Lihuaxuella thermophila]SEN39973.1 hypothetical protein SAMN05444955_110128 [Lihuaxuella thermophila]